MAEKKLIPENVRDALRNILDNAEHSFPHYRQDGDSKEYYLFEYLKSSSSSKPVIADQNFSDDAFRQMVQMFIEKKEVPASV